MPKEKPQSRKVIPLSESKGISGEKNPVFRLSHTTHRLGTDTIVKKQIVKHPGNIRVFYVRGVRPTKGGQVTYRKVGPMRKYAFKDDKGVNSNASWFNPSQKIKKLHENMAGDNPFHNAEHSSSEMIEDEKGRKKVFNQRIVQAIDHVKELIDKNP